MSEMGLEYSSLRVGVGDWADLSTTLSDSATSLSGASTSGLAPSVVASAQGFLSAWAGFARESAAIATGFSDALDAASSDYAAGDDQTQTDFTDLDGRLGPAR